MALADCTLAATAVCDGVSCANETRSPGSIIYNADYAIIEGCVGTTWVALGSLQIPSGPVGCPIIGDVCSDGSYYIGQFTGNQIFATAAANEASKTWNNGSNSYTASGAYSQTDGIGNTEILVALADAGAPYQAADYCDGLFAHGHSDWYLPAWTELDLLWNGGTPVAGVNTSGLYYWSSTEDGTPSSYVERYSDGNRGGIGKSNTSLVRCFRRQ